MKLYELGERYSFHDGIVDSIDYNADIKELTLDIELSAYMQDVHNDNDSIPLSIRFIGVDSFEYPASFLPDDTILEERIDGNCLILLMENSETFDCYELSIKASKAEIIEPR